MSPVIARLPLIRFLFRGQDAVAADHARRWRQAFLDQPELAGNLIRLGGVLTLPPERLVNGEAMPDPVDPIRMARDEGRRALAIELLALGSIDIEELGALIGEGVR